MRKVLIISAFIALMIASSLFGSLITAKELDGMDDVTIVSTRSPKDYKMVHIESAINVYHKGLYQDGEIKGLLKSPNELATILGEKGLTRDTKVVIYDVGDMKFAGRLYWIFKFLGMKDVHILDGGMKAWRKARKPVSRDAVATEPATFTTACKYDILASTDYVKDNKASAVLVDVRSRDEFDGKTGEVKQKGHIEGAKHLHFEELINDDGTMKSKADIQKIFDGVGASKGKEIILYCETSVRTGIVYFALAELLGYNNVKVYDGALYEWEAKGNSVVK
ncbi:MAG: sulfurtransferase [Candidatus Zixiibacteriota bacterium]